MNGQIHPLCGIYSRDCLSAATLLLEEGNNSMRSLLSIVEAQFVPITASLPFYHPDILRNINDPAALGGLTGT
jgi:molybdopterin-guanine dinucleotide biosynthesis protein A